MILYNYNGLVGVGDDDEDFNDDDDDDDDDEAEDDDYGDDNDEARDENYMQMIAFIHKKENESMKCWQNKSKLNLLVFPLMLFLYNSSVLLKTQMDVINKKHRYYHQ